MSPDYLSPHHCEFWLGRAGSGKTMRCLAEIGTELRRMPRGRPLLLIVPEQASAQMERRLAATTGTSMGFTRARVLSFRHLANEAFTQTGGRPAESIGEYGRVMLLRRILRHRQRKLAVFQQAAPLPGMAEQLSQTLQEFQHYGWTRETLGAWLEATPEVERQGDPLARKLGDLKLVWDDYAAALARAGLADPLEETAAASAAIGRWGALEGAQVWVDAFVSFTAQELAILEALMGHAETMVVTLTLDPAELAQREMRGEAEINGGRRTSGEPGRALPRIGLERLFENVLSTYETLEGLCREAGWTTQRIVLPAEGQATRFAAAAALGHLERGVLGRMRPLRFSAGEPGEVSNDLTKLMQIESIQLDTDREASDPAIELIEAADRRAEIEAVARRIVMLCRRPAPALPLAEQLDFFDAGERHDADDAQGGPGETWRDVAVLARDLAPYEALIREVFGRFEIPYFMDRPREMHGHPLARLLLSALGVLRSGYGGEAALRHLKSGLAGLRDLDAIAALENHILATDPHGQGWRAELERSPRLLAAWREAQAPLAVLEQALRGGANPARALWGFLEQVRAGEALEALAAAERDGAWSGDRGQGEEAAQLHEQAWQQTIAWLEELEQIEEALPLKAEAGESGKAAGQGFYALLDDLTVMIDSALAVTRARLTPPTLNQVSIGSIDRTRTPDVTTAFVIGMNAGELPRFWNPDALLGDEERARLASAGKRLGPDSRQKRMHEHYLAYMALTRASRRLVLSRPLRGEEGAATDPSPYFTLVAEAFDETTAPRRLVGRAAQDESAGLGLRPEEWALRLARGLGEVETRAGAAAMAALMRQGDPLGEATLERGMRERLLAARRHWADPPRARLSAGLARRYWEAAPALAVTALERYGACPYQFYLTHMLRLRERDRAGLQAFDFGRLRHEILNLLFSRLAEGDAGLQWGSVDAGRAGPILAEFMDNLAEHRDWGAHARRGGLAHLTLQAAARDLALFVETMRAVGTCTGLRQVAAEWSFGRERPLAVAAEGIEFMLRGQIDRIDVLRGPEADGGEIFFLFDYKTGGRRLDLAGMVGGLELQLALYAWAVRHGYHAGGAESGRGPVDLARIGGLFYWPIKLGLQDAEGMFEDDEAREADADVLRHVPRLAGLFDETMHGALDRAVAHPGRSPAFPFTLTAKGALHGAGKNNFWSRAALDHLLERQWEVVRGFLGAIVRGEIAPRPARNRKALACERCDAAAQCRRHDVDRLEARVLEQVTKEQLELELGARDE